MIGTPTVLSALLMALLFLLPPLCLGDVRRACALSQGVLAGDVGDVGDVGDSLIHHAIHRWRPIGLVAVAIHPRTVDETALHVHRHPLHPQRATDRQVVAAA
ncbi:hypothetical protein CATMQ487_20940 [Sphaerotilus microaerophilus]|uniref:Secreted protein n=2 Tax=Sphaerotilus microaerophilus TaxID=2914710 RepID=A0ABN6PJB1_9BURK|nr:hypothetical protein CATMQ487_20940 [Sphaerotilus sp. FB-5]